MYLKTLVPMLLKPVFCSIAPLPRVRDSRTRLQSPAGVFASARVAITRVNIFPPSAKLQPTRNLPSARGAL